MSAALLFIFCCCLSQGPVIFGLAYLIDGKATTHDRMFPSDNHIETFKTEFGGESVLQRFTIPRQSFCGTQAAVVITPGQTKDATLQHAWDLVRSIARWMLAHASELPSTERYEIIVCWSQSVRRLQGQIFKVGGERSAVQVISDSAEWMQCGHAPLARWEKDVFENRVA